jgi:hypothetical protein
VTRDEFLKLSISWSAQESPTSWPYISKFNNVGDFYTCWSQHELVNSIRIYAPDDSVLVELSKPFPNLDQLIAEHTEMNISDKSILEL